ncbi:unnamed protein product, partial [Prorocentrum cordatum]
VLSEDDYNINLALAVEICSSDDDPLAESSMRDAATDALAESSTRDAADTLPESSMRDAADTLPEPEAPVFENGQNSSFKEPETPVFEKGRIPTPLRVPNVDELLAAAKLKPGACVEPDAVDGIPKVAKANAKAQPAPQVFDNIPKVAMAKAEPVAPQVFDSIPKVAMAKAGPAPQVFDGIPKVAMAKAEPVPQVFDSTPIAKAKPPPCDGTPEIAKPKRPPSDGIPKIAKAKPPPSDGIPKIAKAKPPPAKAKAAKAAGGATAALTEAKAAHMAKLGQTSALRAAARYDIDKWNAEWAHVIAKMPEEAKPKGPHGQFSWTAHTTVGPLHKQCSIEAILRNKGWRVAKPKMTKEEEPLTPWNDDIANAWEVTKQKAEKKLYEVAD